MRLTMRRVSRTSKVRRAVFTRPRRHSRAPSRRSRTRAVIHAPEPPEVFRATARSIADAAGNTATARAPDPGPSRRCLRRVRDSRSIARRVRPRRRERDRAHARLSVRRSRSERVGPRRTVHPSTPSPAREPRPRAPSPSDLLNCAGLGLNRDAGFAVVALTEKLTECGERPDVVAEDLERREQRDREKGARHAPDPEKERQPDEDCDGIQRKPMPEQRRRDEVGLNQVDCEKAPRNQERVSDAVERASVRPIPK